MKMKYGYYEYNHRDWQCSGPICSAINIFNLNCYIPFMKRKTIREDETKMLAMLTEMVELMNEHVKEMKRV